jgi:Mg-chelatase subunit ChlD
MILGKFIKQRKKTLSLLTFCLAALCLPLLAAAQNSPATNQPSAITESQAVRQCGYTLKKVPVSFRQGPVMNFAFSIESDNKTKFIALKQESIEAFNDGDKLRIDPGALENKTKVPVAVMILIDVSKSMRRQEFRKLDAIKDTLHNFIASNPFEDGDRIAIAKFDDSMQIVQSPTSVADSLYSAVDRLNGSNGTLFYDAILSALKRAKSEGVQNLIVLSDGVDSSPTANYYRETGQQDQLLAYENSREREIIEIAQRLDIRIFTIEMGNTSEAYPAMYVYRDSPANISRATGGGEDYYIDLIELRQYSDYYSRLAGKLKEVMEQIRKTYQYDYLLPLSLVGRVQPDGKQHTALINFQFDRCVLPVEVKYAWYPGEVAPRELSTTILEAIFINPKPVVPGGPNDLSEITSIYLMIMTALGLLSGVPLVGQRMVEERGTRQIRRSIVKVEKGSPYIGKECPSERGFRRFHEGDLLLICPDPNCKLPHHLDCWYQARGRCYRRNCSLSSNPRPLPDTLVKSYKLPPVS